ncbi:MAG: hypothetical protein VB934_03680 [Polyangiaceae bacterium]
MLLLIGFVSNCAVGGKDAYLASLGTGGSDPGTSANGGAGEDPSTTAGTDVTTGGSSEPDCPHEGPPILDPSTLPSCPNTICGGGARCLPTSLVPSDFQSQLAACDDDNLCVPDPFIETGGNFIAPSCTSIAGAEGRCLSTCLPQIGKQAAMLPQSTCQVNEVCAPCYDPTSGEDTGACALSCDPGPSEPPVVLPKCCDGIGTCVPTSSVPADKLAHLGKDVCPSDEDLVCAPDVFVEDASYKPPSCQTSMISLLLGEQYKAGACLPACLEAVQNFMIQEDGCGAGYKCAPCNDPLNNGAPSGACDF